MAFANKIGNLLKNAINSSPSIYQSIRCMSSSKIFIGGMSYNTDDRSLREACTSFGEVIEARVILDRETGRSRGFGFVTFTSEEEASAAISGMDGKDLHGRVVRVNYANDRSTGGFRGGGGGYGGGGYGGGSGGYGGGGYSGGSYAAGGGYGGGGGGYGGGYGGGGGSNYPSGDTGASSFGSSAGGGYGSGGTYPSGDSGVSSFGSSGAGGGNYPSGDGGISSFGASSGSDPYGSSAIGGGDGFGKEDDVLDSMKDEDYEPDDFANKRS